jgi:hypothetical protein
MLRTRATALICGTILIFAAVFWPGIYRYDRFGSVDDGLPMRVNRLTGHTQLFTGSEWIALGDRSAAEQVVTRSELSPEEIALLSGTASFQYGNSVRVELYNGTDAIVRSVEFNISAQPLDDSNPLSEILCPSWTRRFIRDLTIMPRSTARDFFSVAADVSSCSLAWSVTSASR